MSNDKVSVPPPHAPIYYFSHTVRLEPVKMSGASNENLDDAKSDTGIYEHDTNMSRTHQYSILVKVRSMSPAAYTFRKSYR